MSFSPEEIEEFKAEAIELLETAEKSLLAVDQGAEFKASFDSIFRCFHNLKGASGMMELLDLQAHTHELENILMKFKDTNSIPKSHVDLFLRGVDAARRILDGEKISFDYKVPDAPSSVVASVVPATAQLATPAKAMGVDLNLSEFLLETDEIIDRVSKALESIEKKNFDRGLIDSLYRDVHSLKGTAFLFSFVKLGEIAHAMETCLEKVREGTHLPSPDLIDGLFKCLRVIEQLTSKISKKESDEDMSSLVQTLSKVLLATAEKLPLAEVPAVSVAPVVIVEPISPPPVEVSRPSESAQAQVEVASAQIENSPTPKEKDPEGATSIRVPVPLLDKLMTLMGEMVLVRNQVLQYSNRSEDLEFLSMSKRLNVVTSEIQAEMMKTRMQPIGNVLTKFNRVVRDLSQELGKDIQLDLIGADTELDKSLLEAIKDPLTHIVRNSCDHGIETLEQRKTSGKSSTGTISIHAYHEGGQVVIEVSDDGKGLHREVLLKKAIEKGLINQAQSLKMSEKETLNLIFAPGFSTAAKVTNVSGRGVGMDVVRTNIEKIGGTVDLSSNQGSGTTIKIKIPLTLAIVPALIVRCGKGTFAIPQVKLVELVRVDPTSQDNRIEFLHGSPVFRLRGRILPLIDMNNILNLFERKREDYRNAILNIAVLNAEHGSFGVIIDEIQDTADIVVKPLNRLLKSLQVYSGATILGDGSVALILDVLGISKVGKLFGENHFSDESESAQKKMQAKLSESQDFILFKTSSPTKHAIPLSYVHRLEEFPSTSVELSGDQRVLRYRNIILPLIQANKELGYPVLPQEAKNISVIVIQRAGTLMGIEVDEILDTLTTSLEVDAGVSKHPGIFGNLNMKDELVVVVDPFQLMDQALPSKQKEVHGGIPSAVGASRNFQGRRVLLAEDTPFFRKAVCTVLERAGFQVECAGDGQAAAELLQKSDMPFDLIVSDIEMPKMNGFELARHVRANGKVSHLPMIALSSRADQKYQTEGRKAGFDIYLEKMKPDVLLAEIDRLLKTERKAAS